MKQSTLNPGTHKEAFTEILSLTTPRIKDRKEGGEIELDEKPIPTFLFALFFITGVEGCWMTDLYNRFGFESFLLCQ